MMNNAQQPISKVRAFAETAESRGCYSKTQRGNLETAWTIFLKNSSDMSLPAESTTIEQILPVVDAVFRQYGAENKVSPSTVRAYQTRVKHLLDDFVAHNGGDFMAWKESLSRAAAAAATRSRKRRRAPEPAPETPQPQPEGVSHRLLLSGGREGALTLPPDLSDADIEPIWQQLEALKTLIRAQITAVTGNASQ